MLIFACLLQIFPPNLGFHTILQVLMKAKLATTVLIYKKLHQINMSQLNKVSSGKVVNVVASDLNKLMGGFFLPNLFAVPIVIVFSLVFLW